MHACGVRHGDLKAENVLLTSWNWLLISDLAPYKPVYVDLENPADFTYYFDTCGRRRCYLAPERFLRGAATVRARAQHSHVTAAMDVFSVGCTIAELLTQEPLFQYSDMVTFVNQGIVSQHTQVHFPPVPLAHWHRVGGRRFFVALGRAPAVLAALFLVAGLPNSNGSSSFPSHCTAENTALIPLEGARTGSPGTTRSSTPAHGHPRAAHDSA
jgi:serine/threonine protein kinase